MKKNGWWVFVCMMLAFVAPVRAEVNDNLTAISAAFSTGNYSKGLASVRQAFAKLGPDQSVQATYLIQSILAIVPMELSGQVVAAAIEANPALGNVILSGISSTSETEQLAILSRLSFTASQKPQSFNAVSESLPKMLNAADANVSVSERLTSPDYNPSNLLSETGVAISPHNPDLRKDRRDLQQDKLELSLDQLKLILDRLEHKSAEVIAKDEQKIDSVSQDIRQDRQDIREDKNGN